MYADTTLEASDDDAMTEAHAGLLSSLRQSLSKSSVGSLLASYRVSIQKDLQETFGGSVQNAQDRPSPLVQEVHDEPHADNLPMLSRRVRPISMAEVKHTVAKIATRGRARASSLAGSSMSAFSRISADEPATDLVKSARRQSDASESGTPPLTPDSTFSSLADSPQTQYPALYGGFEPTPPSSNDEVDQCYKLSRQEIRRGKRPQRILVSGAHIVSCSYTQHDPRVAELHKRALA